MSRSPSEQYLRQIPIVLARILGVEEGSLTIQKTVNTNLQPDLVVRAGSRIFTIEFKAPGTPALIGQAIGQAQSYARSIGGNTIPLVATTYMGPGAAELCESAGVAWLDLAGNAWMRTKDLYVNIKGLPNILKHRGRPASLFSPKSSRVIRHLLLQPDHAFGQEELRKLASLDSGYVSRILKRLEREGIIERDDDRLIRVKNPRLLLESWHEAYDFRKHTIIPGHIAARTGEAIQRQVSRALGQLSIDHAITGLGAAWKYNQFATFRMATVYVRTHPSEKVLHAIKADLAPEGANLWLVVPKDEGVLHGARRIRESSFEDVPVVAPLQAYLDLKDHPERAKEAAERLRNTELSWSLDGKEAPGTQTTTR